MVMKQEVLLEDLDWFQLDMQATLNRYAMAFC